MENDQQRPAFVSLLLDETKRRYESGGIVRIVPIWIILFVVLSAFAAWKVPASFWGDPAKDIPVYVGVLTLDGLLLALAWSAFAKIFENICTPKFIGYLRQNDLIQTYTFHISYVHAAQVGALCWSGLGLALLIYEDVSLLLQRAVLCVTIASTMYAIKEAVGAVTLLYDLVWYRAIFESDVEARERIPRIPPSSTKAS